MSALQVQALQYVKYIPDMPDDKLRILIDTFQSLVAPMDHSTKETATFAEKPRKLGSMKGLTFIADGHDIDDYNDEIAQMFGVLTDESPN